MIWDCMWCQNPVLQSGGVYESVLVVICHPQNTEAGLLLTWKENGRRMALNPRS